MAKDVGKSKSTITWARRSLGIPAFQDHSATWLTRSVVARLGTEPDFELARKLGVHRTSVMNARLQRTSRRSPGETVAEPWMTPQIEERLGKENDASLAREFGLEPRKVTQARVERGIRKKRIYPSITTHPPSWLTPEVMAKLGTIPDGVIAADIGVTVHKVRYARAELGIPSMREAARASARRRRSKANAETA